MLRIRHIHDDRIKYDAYSRGKRPSRSKNVELRVIIDRTEMPYGSDKYDLVSLADKIWTIFIQESNFTKFDVYAPYALYGSFENVEKSEHTDDSFWVTLNYADYGTDLSSVAIKKSFVRSFEVFNANKLYKEDEDKFWNEVRSEVRNVIDTELTGKPGRIKKVRK